MKMTISVGFPAAIAGFLSAAAFVLLAAAARAWLVAADLGRAALFNRLIRGALVPAFDEIVHL
jgi:hypothetical protein